MKVEILDGQEMILSALVLFEGIKKRETVIRIGKFWGEISALVRAMLVKLIQAKVVPGV